MTTLGKLALTNRTQTKAKVDPVIRSRTKFVAALQQQINIVAAEAEGETYTVDRQRWKTMDDGSRERVTVQVAPRKWFWEDEGIIFLMPKIGVRPLELEKGKPTIDVGPMKELIPILEMIARATKAGELDKQIAVANSRTKVK